MIYSNHRVILRVKVCTLYERPGRHVEFPTLVYYGHASSLCLQEMEAEDLKRQRNRENCCYENGITRFALERHRLRDEESWHSHEGLKKILQIQEDWEEVGWPD